MGLINKIIKSISSSSTQKESVNRVNLWSEEDQKKTERHLYKTSPHYKELVDREKLGDKQMVQVDKAIQLFESGSKETAINMLDQLIMIDGFVVNSQTVLMKYLDMLYKTEKYDKAWQVSNEYMIRYRDIVPTYKIHDFQAKVLKKEKRFNDALFHQILSIVYQDSQRIANNSTEAVKKKIDPILKSASLIDKSNDVYSLINLSIIKGQPVNVSKIKTELEKIII